MKIWEFLAAVSVGFALMFLFAGLYFGANREPYCGLLFALCGTGFLILAALCVIAGLLIQRFGGENSENAGH